MKLLRSNFQKVKSSQIYLYSAFYNTDCIKAASQYQSKQLNSVCLLLEKRHPSLLLFKQTDYTRTDFL